MKSIGIVIDSWKLKAYKKALKNFNFTAEPITDVPDVSDCTLISVLTDNVEGLKVIATQLETKLRNKNLH